MKTRASLLPTKRNTFTCYSDSRYGNNQINMGGWLGGSQWLCLPCATEAGEKGWTGWVSGLNYCRAESACVLEGVRRGWMITKAATSRSRASLERSLEISVPEATGESDKLVKKLNHWSEATSTNGKGAILLQLIESGYGWISAISSAFRRAGKGERFCGIASNRFVKMRPKWRWAALRSNPRNQTRSSVNII